MANNTETAPDLARVITKDLSASMGASFPNKGSGFYLSEGDNKPFLVLQPFPDSYTLMWPGEALGPDNLELVAAMGGRLAKEVEDHSTRHQQTIQFGVGMFEGEDDRYSYDQRSTTISGHETPIVPGEISRYFTPRIPDLEAMLVNFSVSGSSHDHDAQIWMEGPKGRESKELGVNIPAGVYPLEELAPLMQRTSTLLRNVSVPQVQDFLAAILSRDPQS